MTLGDKIRKYRNLKGWTQKQLGMEIGFSAATADSRIRKYESDIMAPKAEIRQKLAEKLDVDISALSDNSITSVEDVMQILFYLEEEYGMTIDRDENKTTFSFDNNKCPTDKLGLLSNTSKYDLFASYLYAWYSKNKSLNPDDPDSETEYLKWKARFPRDLYEYWSEQKTKLDSIYDPAVEEYSKNHPAVNNVSELLIQIRTMIESDLTVKADSVLLGAGDGGMELTFLLSELLNESRSDSKTAFVGFLYCLRCFKDKGMCIYELAKTNEQGTHVSYVLRYSPLQAYVHDIEILNDYLKHKEKYNDFESKMIENNYKDNISKFDIDLSSDHIKFHTN